MEPHRPTPLSYASRPGADRGYGVGCAVVLPIILLGLGAIAPTLALWRLHRLRGDPFGWDLLIPLIGWAAANVIALIVGGIGWAVTRTSEKRRIHLLYAAGNVVNWLALGGLAALFIFG
jgi:hypothetical protein